MTDGQGRRMRRWSRWPTHHPRRGWGGTGAARGSDPRGGIEEQARHPGRADRARRAPASCDAGDSKSAALRFAGGLCDGRHPRRLEHPLGLSQDLRLGLRRRLPRARGRQDAGRHGRAARHRRGAAAAGFRGDRIGGVRRHRARRVALEADPRHHPDRRPLFREPRRAEPGNRHVPPLRTHRGSDRPQPRRAVDLRELRRRGADAAVQLLLPRHVQRAPGIRRAVLLVSARLHLRAARGAERRNRHVRHLRRFRPAAPLAHLAHPQPL